jgi:hypothetical protein
MDHIEDKLSMLIKEGKKALNPEITTMGKDKVDNVSGARRENKH